MAEGEAEAGLESEAGAPVGPGTAPETLVAPLPVVSFLGHRNHPRGVQQDFRPFHGSLAGVSR